MILVFAVAFLINLGGVFLMLFKPAGNGRIDLAKTICEKYPQGVTVYCIYYNGPFTEGYAKDLTAHFYLPSNVILRDFGEVSEQSEKVGFKENSIVVLPSNYITGQLYVQGKRFKHAESSISEWLQQLNGFYHVYNAQRTLYMYVRDEE